MKCLHLDIARTQKMESKQFGEQMLLLSHLFSDTYPKPPEGETKQRRRRRKGKGEAGVAGLKKRRLSEEQVKFLEMSFGKEHKLQSERKARLASEIGLDPRQVSVWFQNRRARWKSKQLEEECQRLKSLYEAVSAEKLQLEAENMELRKKLAGAENEISKACSVDKSCSPSSSFTVSANQAFPADFDLEDENFLYENINIPCLDWLSFYSM